PNSTRPLLSSLLTRHQPLYTPFPYTTLFRSAINYKTEDVNKALDAACPNGIDVYFENVGGEIADAVFPLLNNFARIPVCGAISTDRKSTRLNSVTFRSRMPSSA